MQAMCLTEWRESMLQICFCSIKCPLLTVVPLAFACVSHLADLVQGVLSISSSVFEVVMSWECPVDVPGDGTVLRGLLTVRQKVDGVSQRVRFSHLRIHMKFY